MESSSVGFIHGDLKKPFISSVLKYNPAEKKEEKKPQTNAKIHPPIYFNVCSMKNYWWKFSSKL